MQKEQIEETAWLTLGYSPHIETTLVLAGAVLKAKHLDTPAAPHGTEMPNFYNMRSQLPITPTRNLKCAKRKEGGSRITSTYSPSSGTCYCLFADRAQTLHILHKIKV